MAKVYDNGGKTFDRYTIILKDKSMFGSSQMPFHPLGFGMYCGDWQGGKGSTRHLGKKVEDIKTLPKQVQKYIKYLEEC